MAKKIRRRIPQELKIRAGLQQEINSECPFPLCDNREVGHLQIHHIDENPQNNLPSNLLLLCPVCHSKITKGDISQEEVKRIKSRLPHPKIELVTVDIDSKNCSWITYRDTPNAFLRRGNTKSPFPILDFSLINHTKQTILLTTIQLRTKYLYSGLSGIPEPYILKSSVKYKLPIPDHEKTVVYKLRNQLAIPAERAFKFQIELFEKGIKGEKYGINGKYVLYFSFGFGTYTITVPDIFLNCKSESEKIGFNVLT